jgi:hypothetical protein
MNLEDNGAQEKTRTSLHPLHSSEWNVDIHRPRRCDIANRMAMRHPLCQREWRLIYVLFRASLRLPVCLRNAAPVQRR